MREGCVENPSCSRMRANRPAWRERGAQGCGAKYEGEGRDKAEVRLLCSIYVQNGRGTVVPSYMPT